jgi:hypothetical protein
MARCETAFVQQGLCVPCAHECCTWSSRKKQKENQEDLLKLANENTVKALRAGGGDGGAAATGRKVSAVEAYRSIDEMPSSRDLAIEARANHMF